MTVDLVVLTIDDGTLCALLIRRGEPPYKGKWALPGGFVREHEDLDQAAARELDEETSIRGHLEQLASFGTPHRDPRGRVVTIAYLAMLPGAPPPAAGTDAAEAAWHPVDRLPKLAFDHADILDTGLERARAKLEYTPLGAAFCPAEFTIAELRAVYETVWGVPLDPRNFHRKVTTTPGFVRETPRSTEGERGRPARLYRKGPATSLHPPLLRPDAV